MHIVTHSGNLGVLTVSKTPRETLGVLDSGFSRYQGKNQGVHNSIYQYVKCLEEVKVGDLLYVKPDNTASLTKEYSDTLLGFALINAPAMSYFFIGISGCFLAKTEAAEINKPVFLNQETGLLTKEFETNQLQNSSFLSTEIDQNGNAVILIR